MHHKYWSDFFGYLYILYYEWDFSRFQENGFRTENVNRLKLRLLIPLLSTFWRTPVHIIVGWDIKTSDTFLECIGKGGTNSFILEFIEPFKWVKEIQKLKKRSKCSIHKKETWREIKEIMPTQGDILKFFGSLLENLFYNSVCFRLSISMSSFSFF